LLQPECRGQLDLSSLQNSTEKKVCCWAVTYKKPLK
jgi:hypothetical protein